MTQKKIRIHYSLDQSSPFHPVIWRPGRVNEPTHHVKSPIFEPRHPASCSLSQNGTTSIATTATTTTTTTTTCVPTPPFFTTWCFDKCSTTIFYNNNLSSQYNITRYPCNCNWTIIIATLILPPYCPQSSGLWRQNRIPLVQATVATPIITLPNLRRLGTLSEVVFQKAWNVWKHDRL